LKTWLAVLAGFVVVLLLGVIVARGQDNTGETVRPSAWADDVCGTVGAWEGQLEDIGDDVALSNVGARQNDGGSGDHVEGTLYVREALGRVIQATNDTLQEGLKRAGAPDVAQGEEASLILRNWAQQTENDLHAVRVLLKASPNTTAAAFRGLGATVAVLERSAIAGRAAFRQVAALDSELASAIEDESNCEELMREEP
jgi:hypothetical protein